MIFTAAYFATATLGTIEAAYSGLTVTQALILGVVTGAVPSAVAAFINRNKTKVDVTKALVDASATLLSDYRRRDGELESRLAEAESKARLALVAEAECHRRLSQLENRVDSLRIVDDSTPT